MELTTFRSHISTRIDGQWELLATAAGHSASLLATSAGLEGAAFKLGIGHLAGTPSLVERRVAAVAAHDPRQLVAISRGWRRPTEIGEALLDAELDLLLTAWQSAVRFLVALAAVTRADLNTWHVGLSQEVDVIFTPPTDSPQNWEELVVGLAEGQVQHPDIRRLDGRQLTLAQFGEDEILDLLTRGTNGVPALGRARVLRGRQDMLTTDAVSRLCAMIRQLVALPANAVRFGEIAVAVEAVVALVPDLRSELMERVIALLRVGVPPQDVAPLTYVLLGNGWTTP